MLAFALGVTSLAVVASRSDGLPKLPMLATGAGSREASTASGMAPMAADMAYWAVRYEAGPGLEAPGGKAAAYRLRGGSDADVARLAKALGLDGPVQRTDGGRVVEAGGFALHVQDGAGNPWYVGPSCESGADHDPVLASMCGGQGGGVVTADAAVSSPAAGSSGSSSGSGSSGSVSGGSASAGSSSGGDPGRAPPTTATTIAERPPGVDGCRPCPPGAMCTAVCLPPDGAIDPPKRPEGLLSEADAEAKARTIFAAIGLDLAGATVETFDEFSAWRVQVVPVVKGVRAAGMESSLAVGVGGRVVGGNGLLGQPERLGAYPLIGVAEAIRRLNGEGPGSMGGGVPMGVGTVRVAGGTAVDLPATEPALRVETPSLAVPPPGVGTVQGVPAPGAPVTVPPTTIAPCLSLPPNAGLTPIAPTCDPNPCGPTADCATRPWPEPAPQPTEPQVITVTSLRLVLQVIDGVLVPAFEALATVEGSAEPQVTGLVPAIPAEHLAQPKPAPVPEPEPLPGSIEPVPATIEPVPAERPVPEAMKTALEQDFDSGVSGWAVTQRRGPTSWDVEVHGSALRPGAAYSVLIGRPQPDGGTPFPTVCAFTAGPDGNGTCTGRVELPEGTGPTTVSLMGPDGRAVAQGRFM